jgi:hypothetical protein
MRQCILHEAKTKISELIQAALDGGVRLLPATAEQLALRT